MIEIARRGSRARRRGVTLVEVLIVVAIMATIAGTVTVLAFGELKKARVRTAAIGAYPLHGPRRSQEQRPSPR